MTDVQDVAFQIGGTRCAAWYFRAHNESLAGSGGRPVVVMAHGLGGTMDSGLAPFAQRLAAAGLDVLAFDYRGFGASDGRPRQQVRLEDQLDDYRAAIVAAVAIDGVDPNRVVLWGVSLSGGHVLTVSAGRSDIAAVVSMTPLVNGIAAGRLALANVPKASIARSTALGYRSKVNRRIGRGPVMMPIVADPGELGALTLPGYKADYLAIAGPTWENRVDAALGSEIGGYRVGKCASDITAPVLMQIADFDRSAPPHAAAETAFAARAEVRHYPCDHFGIYHGQDWFDAACDHQILFLTRHLASSTA
ncbi:lysophospholipase [Gordonia sp. HY442]|uniref:alpha/beta hydrolase n=1 Tax=Gordonia zhenghanii TaxID=2911516 RepID=UPI001F391B8F|nr:alpha/beta fold hydrolase [Gordonia zhenghanii]MCF8602117.1 lysophospholipase [Gordonia zhenghanii]